MLVASRTHAFTWGADVVTAVPLALAALCSSTLRPPPRRRRRHRRRRLSPALVTVGPGAHPGRLGIDAAFAWVAPIAAVTAWELYCLFTLPRSAHPTLSSILDMLDVHPAGKALAFAAWLVLGWLLVAA